MLQRQIGKGAGERLLDNVIIVIFPTSHHCLAVSLETNVAMAAGVRN
jgi:hypothetical protein